MIWRFLLSWLLTEVLDRELFRPTAARSNTVVCNQSMQNLHQFCLTFDLDFRAKLVKDNWCKMTNQLWAQLFKLRFRQDLRSWAELTSAELRLKLRKCKWHKVNKASRENCENHTKNENFRNLPSSEVSALPNLYKCFLFCAYFVIDKNWRKTSMTMELVSCLFLKYLISSQMLIWSKMV